MSLHLGNQTTDMITPRKKHDPSKPTSDYDLQRRSSLVTQLSKYSGSFFTGLYLSLGKRSIQISDCVHFLQDG